MNDTSIRPERLAAITRQLTRLPFALGTSGIINRLQRRDLQRCVASRPPVVSIILPGSRQCMVVDRSDRIGSLFFWRGMHHRQQLALANDLLPENGVFIDVGANVGEFTVAMAVQKPSSQIYAFEPNPRIRQQLQSNIDANKLTNAVCLPFALGDQTGEQLLYLHDDSCLTSCVAFTDEHRPSEQVEVITLDSFVESKSLRRLDLLKIDVEGFEHKVLSGASHSLTTLRPHIILEVNTITSTAAGFNVVDLYELLRTHRYRFHCWRGRAWREVKDVFPTQEDIWAEPIK